MPKTISNFRGPVYGFLSNYFPCKFEFEGLTYLNSEAAFQAQKCIEDKDKIKYTTLQPNIAKRLGRHEKLRPDWDDISEDVMYRVLKAKFSDEYLAQRLIDTYPAELIEGNTWHDNNWGDCKCYNCSVIPGRNRLGKLLMKVREELMYKK